MKTTPFIIPSCQILIIVLLLGACSKKTQMAMENQIPTKSISIALKDNAKLPIADRIALYHDHKNANPELNLEEEMNLYGYTLLWDGKINEAIEIFKLLVAEYPSSSNTYDSLAEAYQKSGNNEMALINYEKSLALDKDNFNAEDQIENIKFPDRKELTPLEKFSKKYTVDEYSADLDQLSETLLKVHPNALKFISKVEFDDLIASKKAALTAETTYAEFAWHCSEVVASISCSHTGTGRFWWENKMLPIENRFPIQSRLIEDRLFVVDPLNNEELLSVKDEILSINGLPIIEIKEEVFRHIASQGYIETSKRHEFNMWSTGMISYALGFPESYQVEVKGESGQVRLLPAENHLDPMGDKSKVHCGGDLCFEFIDVEKKIAVMTISSFNYYEWNNFEVFQSFIDESMVDLRKHGSEELIIDLRGNGGGSSESSIHLLRYLIDEPFVYYARAEFDSKNEKLPGEYSQVPYADGYRGKLHFLIDGVGNSTTGHFMSLVKTRKLGKIVGEELGSNQFCSAGQKRCRLRNTKLQYDVANNTHVSSATELPDEVGILPDQYVSQSIDEYVDGKDIVKQHVLDYISKERMWTPASKYHSTYFLEADHTWRKEIFQIPLNFAPEMNLRGIEDARFPIGWEVKDSSTFWSYVFAWNVDNPDLLSIDQISLNLETYFNGLMRIKERGDEFHLKSSKVALEKTGSEGEFSYYRGEVETFDGFFDKKAIAFNIQAEQKYCEEIGRAMMIFRFSPKGHEDLVWNKLNEVRMPKDICKP